MMRTKLFLYPTLSAALRNHTAVNDPDYAEKKILYAINQESPSAIQAVLFVKPGTNSPSSRHWTVMPVGPDESYKRIEDVDGTRIQVKNAADQYPVAYVVLHQTEEEPG